MYHTLCTIFKEVYLSELSNDRHISWSISLLIMKKTQKSMGHQDKEYLICRKSNLILYFNSNHLGSNIKQYFLNQTST